MNCFGEFNIIIKADEEFYSSAWNSVGLMFTSSSFFSFECDRTWRHSLLLDN